MFAQNSAQLLLALANRCALFSVPAAQSVAGSQDNSEVPNKGNKFASLINFKRDLFDLLVKARDNIIIIRVSKTHHCNNVACICPCPF